MNMKKYSFKQFISLLTAIRLSPEEKNAARARILAEVRMCPVREVKDVRPLPQRSAGFSFIQLMKRIQYMPIALILTLLASGSASYAANGSLPGDILYPVKIYVNETVEGMLAVSDEAQARFHARLAGERLEEAEQLAAEGNLDAGIRADIEANLENHISKAEEREKRLEDQNKMDAAAGVNAELETSLRVHGNILNIIAGSEAGVEGNVKPIARKAEKEAARAAERRAKTEVKISAEANGKESAEGKMHAAERKLEEVKKFIEGSRANMRGEVTAEAELKLKSAHETFAEGKVKFEAGVYGEAFVLFQKTMRLAEEAKLAMKIHGEVEMKIRLDDTVSTSSKNENRKEDNGTSLLRDPDGREDSTAVDAEGETNIQTEEKNDGGIKNDLRSLFRIRLNQ